jgi:hypothetical protein
MKGRLCMKYVECDKTWTVDEIIKGDDKTRTVDEIIKGDDKTRTVDEIIKKAIKLEL